MIRSFSYGGGTQSTAALVLAARGEIDYPLFIFANVGEDSERPATLEYVHEIAMPYADAHGVELVEVRKHTRDGKPQTLMQRIDASPRAVPIPVRMGPRARPAKRACTAEFKIRTIEKELRRRGATKDVKARVGIGISLDEWQRAGTEIDPHSEYQLRDYPLLERRVTREQCTAIIREEGLPLPPRSACYFCPFHTDHEWMRLAIEDPDLFEKACLLEEKMHARGKVIGKGDFYLTRHGVFLRDLFSSGQEVLFSDESDATCDTGHCMT